MSVQVLTALMPFHLKSISGHVRHLAVKHVTFDLLLAWIIIYIGDETAQKREEEPALAALLEATFCMFPKVFVVSKSQQNLSHCRIFPKCIQ